MRKRPLNHTVFVLEYLSSFFAIHLREVLLALIGKLQAVFVKLENHAGKLENMSVIA
jgi:hypothetical protein